MEDIIRIVVSDHNGETVSSRDIAEDMNKVGSAMLRALKEKDGMSGSTIKISTVEVKSIPSVLITVRGGIVEDVIFFNSVAPAIDALKEFVKKMNPEEYDATVYSSEDKMSDGKMVMNAKQAASILGIQLL